MPAPAPDGFYNGFNTAEGFGALFQLTTGTFNTALGFKALNADTSGGSNTAVGGQALLHNNLGSYNTAVGENALVFNTDGSFNMALGQGALAANTGGSSNTAMGFQALNKNTASDNTAVGYQALASNTTLGGTLQGSVAVGFQALANAVGNADSAANNALGEQALFNATTGFFNEAFGWRALFNVTSGASNTAMGDFAGAGITDGSGIVCIGHDQSSDNISNRTFIQNIGSTSQPVSAGVIEYVTVNLSNNKLGHGTSSRRYKDEIQPMDKASEVLYQLKPVTFRYKKSAEYPNPGLDYGLIAEDVAEVDPELAIRNGEGQIESVRYLAIQNMMLNEFLKEHTTVQEQGATIADLKKEIASLTATVKEQATQIQKVSAQVGMTKPAPKVVANQ